MANSKPKEKKKALNGASFIREYKWWIIILVGILVVLSMCLKRNTKEQNRVFQNGSISITMMWIGTICSKHMN